MSLASRGLRAAAVAVALLGAAPSASAGPDPDPVVDLAAGAWHTCALRASGVVHCWGGNYEGQAAGIPDQLVPRPVKVEGLTDGVAVSAGHDHSCALTRQGTVACWGRVDSARHDSASPVTGLPPTVVQISATQRYTCARLADGSVRCFGALPGSGTFHREPATPVVGLKAKDLACARNHCCALTATGEAVCWGDNDEGQLGQAPEVLKKSLTPVAVPAGQGEGYFTRLAADYDRTCGIDRRGRVLCWGRGLRKPVPPTLVPGVEARQLDMRYETACAVTPAGGVVCWGDGFTPIGSPRPVRGLRPVARLAVGSFHKCALEKGGRLTCWGDDTRGQLATGLTAERVPQPVPGLTGVRQVAGGHSHSCALLGDGTARCWGSGETGKLGNGSIEGSQRPVAVEGLRGARALALGERHSCALIDDGTVRCWGSAVSGATGRDVRLFPDLRPLPVEGIRQATRLASGRDHVCAVVAGGQVKCWGSNWRGQLAGRRLPERASPRPVTVPGLRGVVEVAAGDEHSCAVERSGAVLCWGEGSYGLLGTPPPPSLRPDPRQAVLSAPVRVKVPPARGVVAGLQHGCSLSLRGEVHCWGRNIHGQLGPAVSGKSSHDIYPPRPVALPAPAVELVAGSFHSCVRLAPAAGQPEVICWGDVSTTRRTLLPRPELTGVTALAAGHKHTCALLGSGQVHCWGDAEQGQLGGKSTFSGAPLTVPLP